MTDPRYLAVKLLCKTFGSGGYSNIQLDSGLDSSDLDPRGKRFCSALYYGVIERKITLDSIIDRLSSRPIVRLDQSVLNILRCGIYQLMYMDNVPDNAAVSESVSLAKKFGRTSASGMVNAVLRNFIRQGKKLVLSGTETERLSVKYSVPTDMIESLIIDYGAEKAEKQLELSLEKAPVFLRMNPLKCSEEELLRGLGDIRAEKLADCCYSVSGGDVTATEAFAKGYFHVQDLSSQLCCMGLAPTENDRVLDICAAPGGKTFTIAELMGGRGKVSAFDLHENRVKLIRSGAQRLGLGNITAAAGDASRFDPEMPLFSKILCDVPCSGLGVIRRKPEIKYKSMSDFERLPEIQFKIAENALNYLEVGGELIYSTCTLRKAENDEVADRLLHAHHELEECPLPTLLGRDFGSRVTFFHETFSGDGFFIAKFRKIR